MTLSDFLAAIVKTGGPNLSHLIYVLVLAVLLFGLGLVRRKTTSDVQPKGPSSPIEKHPWALQFPPSRRHVLADLKLNKETAALSSVPTTEVMQRLQVPTTRTADWDRDNQYTPTGFTTQDIRALGRFPDYSVLTGTRYPEPYGPQFDINKAIFRPFRPFRWSYHQTMAYFKFEPDWWVELEQNYVRTLAARQELLKKHGDLVFFTDPGSELACRELMEMLVQSICKRYPQYFRLENDNTILHNRILDTRTNLLTTPPLRVVFANIPEDYALVLRDEKTGLYHLRAAMVCSSVGWDIGMSRGKPLRGIHEHVPDYADRMAFSMDRFFARMPTDQPIQRCSWSLEDHAPLFSSPRMRHGGGDHDHDEEEGEEERPWERSAFAGREGDLRAEHIKLRCDWQTLRRLPLSGAVAFNFKAVFTPLSELRAEPFVPALLLKVLREGKESLITYKTVEHVRQVTMSACKEWAQEQVNKGVVPEDWEVGTLEESPYFPGWREKWKTQQGF